MDSSVFEQTEFHLGTMIASTSSLTQQVLTDAAIPRITTLATHQLAETALRGDHTFARRLLEQAAGKVLGIVAFAQARTVE
ncbi:hypothetical protein PS718_00105 [Pseudomonas fluorescens]|uniref:Uncharacterized protein n=1 Tax=Pseudomonas fluorescens TaxID=294 RepID=A0A5E6ZI43_PSEFL|nr:hypothetical protein PS718_00105 [Pseudomonas fluorescens]